MDLESLRADYSSRFTSHEIFMSKIHEKIAGEIKALNFKVEIYSRVKEIDSFLKKALRKKYSDPINQIKDQVGFRLITLYQDDLAEINDFLQKTFEVVSFEDKLNLLDYDQLGYLGLHYEVCLLAPLHEMDPGYNRMPFEIQVHTKAQNLWAGISHELSYKPALENLSTKVRRSIYRLAALIEIFDQEVTNARNAISSAPELPELRLLLCLERVFRLFTSSKYDKEFSVQNLSCLKNLLSEDEVEEFQKKITDFCTTNKVKLEGIFSAYSLDSRDSYKFLMLFQPESILIFERLEQDKFRLLSVWTDMLPIELLTFLATIWGVDLPDS